MNSSSYWSRSDRTISVIKRTTTAFNEKLAPTLFLPLKFGSAFESDKKFLVKVEKFIETRKEEVYGILVDNAALGEGGRVFLDNKCRYRLECQWLCNAPA